MAEKRVPLALAAVVAAFSAGLAGAAPPGVPVVKAAGAPVITPDPYTQGTVQAGAAKATMCFACHGPNGNSTSPTYPRLAGQGAVYLDEQLHLFRDGKRPNPIMSAMAAGLSNQDIDDLAVYFAAQTPAGLDADPALWKAGRALYISGDRARDVPACAACHGPTGQGNPAAGYPALRAQQSAYVVAQLQSYANGTRYSGPDPATTTPNGGIMFTIAKRLTSAQMQAVASYVQGLR
jgi:cytochrome c553